MTQDELIIIQEKLANFASNCAKNYNSPEVIATLRKSFISHNITIENWNSIVELLSAQGTNIDEICQILSIIGTAISGIPELEHSVEELLNDLNGKYISNSFVNVQTMYELYLQYKNGVAYVHIPETGIDGLLKVTLKPIHSTTYQLIITLEYDKILYSSPNSDTIAAIQHIKATYTSPQGALGTIGIADPIVAFADASLLVEEGSKIEYQTFATDADLVQKQNKLVAGSGISINQDTNVISVTGISGFVDDRLDATSANPVENRVVTNALNNKQNLLGYASVEDIENLFN